MIGGRSSLRVHAAAALIVAGLSWIGVASAHAASADAIEDLCVGGAHSCALAHDGRVACWGDNEVHQVSPDDVAQLDAPRWVADFPPASRLRCSGAATCIETPAGAILCQGRRYHADTRVYRDPKLPVAYSKVTLPRPARDFVATDGGGCAILDDNAVWCWSDENTAWPFPAPGLDDAVSFIVTPGQTRHGCVRRARHEPACVEFGGRDPRNPGAGFPVHVKPLAGLGPADVDQDIAASPLRQSVPAGATAVAVSRDHACALAAGSVLCWGAASDGQLGDGTRYGHPPQPVPGIADATAVVAGGGTVCAARTSGKITCWGRAQQVLSLDENGFANVATRTPPTELSIGPQGGPCVRIATKRACWDGARWRLGASQGQKTDPGFGGSPRSVSADGDCAIDRKGRLGCLVGSVGAPLTERLAWVKGPFTEAVSFRYGRVGRQMACALAKDGRVSCFVFGGAGDERKLIPLSSPALATLTDVTKLAGDHEHSSSMASDVFVGMACALTRDGGVTCWGGPHADALALQRVEGLPPATDIAVGGSFACAVIKDGRVFCWGSNSENGAPNGAPRSRAQPLSVRWPPR